MKIGKKYKFAVFCYFSNVNFSKFNLKIVYKMPILTIFIICLNLTDHFLQPFENLSFATIFSVQNSNFWMAVKTDPFDGLGQKFKFKQIIKKKYGSWWYTASEC
jgi:hypothetical protein